MPITRRNFVKSATSILVPSIMSPILSQTMEPPYPISATPPPIWDLWLVRQSTGEEFKETYVQDQRMSIPGYIKLCHALRDTRAPQNEQVVQIDVRLLNLLFATQQWMKIHNQYRPLMINSGYRTLRTNNSLENAAKNSMHLQGRAADFYIDGLPSKYLSDLVKYFQEGGVGLYVTKHFVHVDTGRIRSWNG